MKCQCENFKHSIVGALSRCKHEAKWTCLVCNRNLCGPCSKKHHAHNNFVRYALRDK